MRISKACSSGPGTGARVPTTTASTTVTAISRIVTATIRASPLARRGRNSPSTYPIITPRCRPRGAISITGLCHVAFAIVSGHPTTRLSGQTGRSSREAATIAMANPTSPRSAFSRGKEAATRLRVLAAL